MLTTSARLRATYVALAATDTWLSGASPRLRQLRWVTKPLLMPTLAASLATDRRAAGSPLRTSTLVGQAFGWGGDVGLLGKGTGPFLAGTASFGLGHVAYASGFRSVRRARPVLTSPGGRGALALWAVSAPVLGVAASRSDPALGVAVPVYAALLSTMLATAGNLDRSQPVAARWSTLAGAALFTASDSALGVRKFVVAAPSPTVHRVVMATYTLAQLLLSEGAARAGQRTGAESAAAAYA